MDFSYLFGEGGDRIGIALMLARDRSSVQLATPDMLKVTFSLIKVSSFVGVEMALSIEALCRFITLDPFN